MCRTILAALLLSIGITANAECPNATGDWVVDIDDSDAGYIELLGTVHFHNDGFSASLTQVYGLGIDGIVNYSGTWERGESCSLILTAVPYKAGWYPAQIVWYFWGKQRAKVIFVDPEYAVLGSGEARKVWYLR